jgi:chromatin remodeling complex protein RSC6
LNYINAQQFQEASHLISDTEEKNETTLRPMRLRQNNERKGDKRRRKKKGEESDSER